MIIDSPVLDLIKTVFPDSRLSDSTTLEVRHLGDVYIYRSRFLTTISSSSAQAVAGYAVRSVSFKIMELGTER